MLILSAGDEVVKG